MKTALEPPLKNVTSSEVSQPWLCRPQLTVCIMWCTPNLLAGRCASTNLRARQKMEGPRCFRRLPLRDHKSQRRPAHCYWDKSRDCHVRSDVIRIALFARNVIQMFCLSDGGEHSLATSKRVIQTSNA